MHLLTQKLKILLALFSVVLCLLLFGAIRNHYLEKQAIVIGCKSNTEQHILAEMLAQLIEKKTEITVVRRFNLDGSTICFNALKSGNIDLYVEYTGGALVDILKEKEHAGELYPYLKERFAQDYAIDWMPLLGFRNQYTLIGRSDLGVSKSSELLALKDGLRFAFDPEFSARLEAKELAEVFHLKRPFVLMDQIVLHFTLLNKKIDLFVGDSTDGKLVHPDIAIIEDDLDIFPSYEAAPIIRHAALEKHPELRPLLMSLEGKISTERMRRANAAVDKERRPIDEVAKELLSFLLEELILETL